MSPTFFIAILGRIMVGLGVSVLFISTLKILANWFTKKEFALVTGILMAVGGLGWLSAATPPALLTGWLGWRVTFLIIGLVNLTLALFTYLIVRDTPTQMGAAGILKAEAHVSSSVWRICFPLPEEHCFHP